MSAINAKKENIQCFLSANILRYTINWIPLNKILQIWEQTPFKLILKINKIYPDQQDNLILLNNFSEWSEWGKEHSLKIYHEFDRGQHFTVRGKKGPFDVVSTICCWLHPTLAPRWKFPPLILVCPQSGHEPGRGQLLRAGGGRGRDGRGRE